MRSTALRRYSSLRPGRKPMRRSWIRRKSPRRIARETPAEREHKALIRQAGICAVAKYADRGRCSGGLQVAHLGKSGGTGRKHGDWTETSLLCARHHRAVDQRLWPFDEMSDEDFAAWKSHEITWPVNSLRAGRR